MRLIYVDEAGTSPAEPVRVVASVVVEGDNELRAITAALSEILEQRVPEPVRTGFIFHCKELFNGGKKVNRDEWPFSDRLDLIKEVLCLPFVHDLPIAVGITFSGIFTREPSGFDFGDRKRQALIEHITAFAGCMERSDVFLRKYLRGKENGIVICEDVPEKRQALQGVGLLYRDNPLSFTSEHQVPDAYQVAHGITPQPVTLEIKHIVDVPHFVDKDGAAMLQLADACAFAFRRFLSRQPHGDDLILAMLGPEIGAEVINDPAWFCGNSSALFNTAKYAAVA